MDEPAVEVAPHVVRDVLDHALATVPDECCGILIGPDPDHITRSVRTENVHPEPRTRYEVDPAAIAAAMEDAVKADGDVVGFYHSHPRGWPRFSAEDEARATWEGGLYVLVCLQPLAFVAAHWREGSFVPCEVRVPSR